jgi:long-chain acyl-CoA synthetase
MTYPYNDLENFTLASLLNRSIKLYHNEPSLGFVGQKAMSYSEFMDKINQTIELLQKNAISKGDKVALLSENMPNWGVAYFAVTYFGAVIVPVLADFHPSEIHNILIHSDAKAVFVSEKHLSVIQENEVPNIKFVVNLETLDIIEKLSDKAHMSQIKNEPPHEDDLAAIIYTSGTTGYSKGVMLSHKNIVTNALSSYCKVKIFPSDTFLSILPLAHTFECTVGLIVPILHGSSVYYTVHAPTPGILLKAFNLVRPTIMLTVPLIIEKIYKNKIIVNFSRSFIVRNLYKIPFIRKILNKIAGKKLLQTFGGRLRMFAIGGAALSPAVEQFLIEADFPYVVGYGLTETAPLLAGSVLGEKPKFKSTGTAFKGVKLKIKDKNPQTGEGEICAKSPSVMMGYYKDEEKTNEVMENGWFLTGDLGHIDDDGFLFISGRSKNVIVGSNGENIYPEQIESIINQHEAVLDSLVMEKKGKLTAKIHLDHELIDKKRDLKTKEEIAGFLEEIREDVNSQVSSFSKIAKFVEQTDSFVKTPTKKIKRYLYAD